MKSLTLANQITIFRILLIPFLIAVVLYYRPEKDYLRFVALGIFLVLSLSDLADGYIARKYRQQSSVGAILDPLADKLLLISAFICIYKISVYFTIRFPIWLIVAVISRDVILLLGAAVIFLVRGDLKVEPTKWGKSNTFAQGCCIVAILLQWPYSPIIWDVTLLLTIGTTLDYLIKGIKMLNQGVTA